MKKDNGRKIFPQKISKIRKLKKETEKKTTRREVKTKEKLVNLLTWE